MSQLLGKYNSLLEQLEDSTQSEHNCMKTFDVKPNAKRYRVLQAITGLWKIEFFSIIFFFKWFDINPKRYKLWSCQKICDGLHYLLDNVFISFGLKL